MNINCEYFKEVTPQFETFKDSEQNAKFFECLDLLISAGYFRAKIQGLNAFDKIVGGMVWCISLCAQCVDVDLLYSENSTIGKKIAVTERIVEVLPKLNCPNLLEPHQIQGLDSQHILPVIQWLVKMAKEIKAKHGDEHTNFAVYQFIQASGNNKNDKIDLDIRPIFKCRKVYKRMVRMKPLFKKNIKNDQTYSLNEKLDLANINDDTKKLDLLIICKDGDYKAAFSNDCQLNNSNFAIYEDTIECLKNQLKMLKQQEIKLDNDIFEKKEQNKIFNLKKNFNCNTVFEHVELRIIKLFKKLLIERDDIKEKESLFKKKCRKEIEDLDLTIEKFQNKNNIENKGNYFKKIVLEFGKEETQFFNDLNSIINDIKKKNSEIYKLEQEIEKYSSQFELNQYQRRFIELCNQMSKKHIETKQFYTFYNTLIDIRNFLKREIDFLNSIEELKYITIQKDYKDSFIENLQNLCQNVDQSLDKILNGKQLLQNHCNDLFNNLQLLINKRRIYKKTVVEFQKECQKMEELRLFLNK